MTSQDWGDPAARYANSVMGVVQANQGPTSYGCGRNQTPYYSFGALFEQSQTPLTQLPAVQWRQTDGRWDYVREMGGFGVTGSMGSWYLDFEIKIYGQTRSQACNEFLYLIQAIIDVQQPNPPIADIRTRWLEPGEAQQNSKETLEVTFTAPVLMPLPTSTLGTIRVISASVSMGPVSGSVPFPSPPSTGSYNIVRQVIVT